MSIAAGEPSDAGGSGEGGAIGHDQTSWMEMKVFGPGTLSFYWKHTPGDYSILRFTIDGDSNRNCNYSTWHQEANIQITGLGMHKLRWECAKQAGAQQTDSRSWVDYVQWAADGSSNSTYLQEGLDTSLDVFTDGDSTWCKDTWESYYGSDSAVSGGIGDEETTQMEVRVYGEGTVTFWWKVSSDSADELQFYIDGDPKDAIDGEADWAQKSYEITGSGTHSLLWQYTKDDSSSDGDDSA